MTIALALRGKKNEKKDLVFQLKSRRDMQTSLIVVFSGVMLGMFFRGDDEILFFAIKLIMIAVIGLFLYYVLYKKTISCPECKKPWTSYDGIHVLNSNICPACQATVALNDYEE